MSADDRFEIRTFFDVLCALSECTRTAKLILYVISYPDRTLQF